jgi:hypothetical protein
MKRQIRNRKIAVKFETLRNLSVGALTAARGGRVNSLTGCEPCHPSDGLPGHCWSNICSGAESCDPATCTISTSG